MEILPNQTLTLSQIKAGVQGELRIPAAEQLARHYCDEGLKVPDIRNLLFVWNGFNKPSPSKDDLDCAIAEALKTQNEKKQSTSESSDLSFPRETMGGLAGEFADLYSKYLESP